MTPRELEAKVNRISDFIEICNLQGRYNHYLGTNQYDKIIGLFAGKTPGVKIELADSGVHEGLEAIINLFTHLGRRYHMVGGLGIHLLMTPVVEVSRDGTRARGMWNSFGTNTRKAADGKLGAMWQLGKYDQTFIREDGKWKYLEFRWYVIFRTPYENGWVKTPIVGGLHDEGFPDVGPLYAPYDPFLDSNSFFPAPPEPEE